MDIVVGGYLAAVTIPIAVAVAAAVKAGSPGPAIFRQERLGKRGRPFTLYKFRTMYQDATTDTHRGYFRQYMQGLPAPGQEGNLYKLDRDHRIAPAGRLLRRLGLDEMPQLLNVIRGDMSLVGPRPPLAYEVEQYSPRHARRLAVKPGLTGLWQIAGRDVVPFERMVDLDLEYIRRQSLKLDVTLMAFTLPTLVRSFARRRAHGC